MSREKRAKEIVEAEMVTAKGSGLYGVQSQSGQGKYTVSLTHRKCHCLDFKKHGNGYRCKHILAAEIYERSKSIEQKMLEWANELDEVSWYDADLARKLARHGLATNAEKDAYYQLRRKYPQNEVLSELNPIRRIATSGGSITLENGEIVSASCARCNRGGLPYNRGGYASCICGNTIAEPREWMTPDEILVQNRAVLHDQVVEL